MKNPTQDSFSSQYLTETWMELTEFLLQHPEKLANSQLNYWQSYLNLFPDLSNPVMDAQSTDKRFQNQEWERNLIYNFIKRSYKLLTEHVEQLTCNLDPNDEKKSKKLQFFSRQFIDSIAPSNFIQTNPEILSKTVESNGENLLEGFKQFQQDLENGHGQLKISLTDTSQFEVGKNIACTEGKIIYQNDLIELIQYSATTEKVHQYPLLIIPPWINKYYILDLQPKNSLVKWLVDKGHTVFLISWVNPDYRYKETAFEDYLSKGPIAALTAIQHITGTEKVNCLGYCIGGTLLGCLLAYLAEMNETDKILSATFLTTLLDFSEPGDLGVFIDEKQVTMLEKHMRETGYLNGNIIASVFNALRANDLIWAAFVKNYLKGEKPQPMDLLYWNADSTNIPEPTHSFYLRKFYMENKLVQPNAIKMKGVSLDLRKITTPSYFLATHDDHIVPWKTSYQSQQYIKSTEQFVLASSGHVAGVINPPFQKKYGYWTNENRPGEAEAYFADAKFHRGSWWNNWRTWLKRYSGKLIPAAPLNNKLCGIIENAPGTYVKIKLGDLEKKEDTIT